VLKVLLYKHKPGLVFFKLRLINFKPENMEKIKMMNPKKAMSAVMILGIALCVSAQDAVLAPGTVADWEAAGSGVTPTAAKENAVLCSGKGNIELLSKNSAKIDPSKSYTFSGMFKSETGSAPFKCYFGLSPLNEKENPVKTIQVKVVKGTEAELAADCSPEDTVLKIKNGESWQPGPHCYIAFETDNTGKYSDLPNTRLSSGGIMKVEKKDAIYEVTMKKGCAAKYPAGTKIRVHSAGPSAIYGGAAGKTVSSEWTEVKGLVKPAELIDNLNLTVNWWPGVQKVKFFVAFYPENSDSAISVSFKDVKLEEVK
jgi:hypothetical protein